MLTMHRATDLPNVSNSSN